MRARCPSSAKSATALVAATTHIIYIYIYIPPLWNAGHALYIYIYIYNIICDHAYYIYTYIYTAVMERGPARAKPAARRDRDRDGPPARGRLSCAMRRVPPRGAAVADSGGRRARVMKRERGGEREGEGGGREREEREKGEGERGSNCVRVFRARSKSML